MNNTPHFANLSLTITNTTQSSVGIDNDCEFPGPIEGKLLFAVNAFLAVLGTFGNVLIIAAILDTPHLRQKVSISLLLSLAVADLIVSAAGIPLFCAILYMRTVLHRCKQVVELIYVVLMIPAGYTSIFHLTAISIDRLVATTRPHQHQAIMKRWWKVILFACWGTAIPSGCLIIPFPVEMQIANLTQFIASVFVIICSYGVILYKIKFRNIVTDHETAQKTAAQIAMEKQVSRAISVAILLFVLCWFPIHILILHNIDSPSIPVKYWWSRCLYLSNSCMNFIVYTLQIRHFRAACARIINRNLERMVFRCMHHTTNS